MIYGAPIRKWCMGPQLYIIYQFWRQNSSDSNYLGIWNWMRLYPIFDLPVFGAKQISFPLKISSRIEFTMYFPEIYNIHTKSLCSTVKQLNICIGSDPVQRYMLMFCKRIKCSPSTRIHWPVSERFLLSTRRRWNDWKQMLNENH